MKIFIFSAAEENQGDVSSRICKLRNTPDASCTNISECIPRANHTFFISRRVSETEKKQSMWNQPSQMPWSNSKWIEKSDPRESRKMRHRNRRPPPPTVGREISDTEKSCHRFPPKKDRNWRCVWTGDRTRKPVMMSSHSSHLPQLQVWRSFSKHASLKRAIVKLSVWKLMQTQAQTHQKWRPSLQRRTLQNIRPPPQKK